MKRIFLSPPHQTGREADYFDQTLHQNWLAPGGHNVVDFEKQLSCILANRPIVAVQSGTAALHIALRLAGVAPGDNVICQSLTFAATAFPITYMGAIPIFIDSESQTWNLCPDVLEQVLKQYAARNKLPKAVIGVHIYGNPLQLEDVIRVCRSYNIPFIEDAACALGATYQGKPVGSFGTTGILSFNGNKIITTTVGGAVIVNNEEEANKVNYWATQSKSPLPYYEHNEVGFNYKMSNVLAGIGLAQLTCLEERIQQRRTNYYEYHRALSTHPFISFQEETIHSVSNRWLTAVRFKENKVKPATLQAKLDQGGIETRRGWKPMHLQPVFKGASYWGGNIAEKLFEEVLCLPSGSNLSNEDLSYVINQVNSCLLS